MQALSQEGLNAAERAFIDQMILSRAGRPGALLGILESIQEHHANKWRAAATRGSRSSSILTPE
jgi:hypothetical protein